MTNMVMLRRLVLGKRFLVQTQRRCALEEERAKRIKVENEYKESKEKIKILEKNAGCMERKLGHISQLLKMLLKPQGAPKDVLASLDMDDEDQDDVFRSNGYENEDDDQNGDEFEDICED